MGTRGLENFAESHAGLATALAKAVQDRGDTLKNDSFSLVRIAHVKAGSEHGIGPAVLRGLEKAVDPVWGAYLNGSGAGGSRSPTGPFVPNGVGG